MATKEEDLPLESCLNKVTNPANREEDWDAINHFCEMVNTELEGSSYAVRLLAHKVQSPIERESLFALSTLDACVKNCGRKFHQEIGKFRFLNEIIKVISPKYLGSKTTEKVKKRCIELLYCWHKGLPQESKITDAYKMLKQQGIVKEDPTYMDQATEKIPKQTEEERRAAFEDEEKSKLLAKLLKSKNPEDLQAANRLIKNMVKQDTERMEKVSKRINELETIKANLKLLGEMVSQFNPQTTTDSEKEMMKELYESLEKLRPKLFRLASETDENDTDGMNAILKANDEVSHVMSHYKSTVEGVETNGQAEPRKEEEIDEGEPGTETASVNPDNNVDNDNHDNDDDDDEAIEGGSSLLDLTFDQSSFSSSTNQNAQTQQQSTRTLSSTILDDELLSLGLKSPGEELKQPEGTVTTNSNNLLSGLEDIFFAGASAAPQQGVPSMGNSFPASQPIPQSMVYAPAAGQMGVVGAPPGYSQTYPAMGQQPVANNAIHSPLTMANNQSALMQQQANAQLSEPQKKAIADLDSLGQTLMQQSLSDTTTKLPFNPTPKGPPPRVSLNQMAGTAPVLGMNPVGGPATHPPPVSAVSGSTDTTLSSTTTPPHKLAGEVQPLTDVFVPLENVQPGSLPPVNAYDKNGLKIVIHISKNRPREDVSVMVVSVMSTNTSAVKGFVFQAAVPKIMKVKLQPPSATDLPAYNPILPPSAITQIMLLANPQKEKIRLKFKITCTVDDKTVSDVGDIDTITVQ